MCVSIRFIQKLAPDLPHTDCGCSITLSFTLHSDTASYITPSLGAMPSLSFEKYEIVYKMIRIKPLNPDNNWKSDLELFILWRLSILVEILQYLFFALSPTLSTSKMYWRQQNILFLLAWCKLKWSSWLYDFVYWVQWRLKVEQN